MKIEFGLVEYDVKAGVAGKPSTRIIDDFVGLKIVEEYSCVGVGDAEVTAEGRLMPLRMMSASSGSISDGDVEAYATMSTKNGVEVGGPELKSAKKNLLQMLSLELDHVYIYYMTSHVHFCGKNPPTA